MKKARVTFVPICLAICLLLTSNVWATSYTYTCTGTADQTAINTQIGSMTTGDVLTISGSCTFTGPVVLTNKNIEVKGPTCTYDSTGLPTSCPTTITVSGQGYCDEFVTSGFCVNMNTGASGTGSAGLAVKKVSWSLHDMTITGSPSVPAIAVTSTHYNYPIQGWRIHHMKLDFGTHSMGQLTIFGGIQWGLIDHVKFISYGDQCINMSNWLDSEYDAGYAAGARPIQSFEGRTSWAFPLHLGSDEALYVEDCDFTYTKTNNPVTDMVAGASVVFRHNTIENSTGVYSHTGEGGNLGRGGARKYEIYNNKQDGGNAAYEAIGFQESGTGVIFNNTLKNYGVNTAQLQLYRASGPGTSFDYTGYYYGNCWGTTNMNHGSSATQSYDGNIETTGWPCLDQIGRGSGVPLGTAQPSVPLYLWNNGTQDKCYNPNAAGPDCDGLAGVFVGQSTALRRPSLSNYISTVAHSNGDKDYCVGTTTMPASCGNHTNTYAPYTYPHPLQAGGSADLVTPQNLRIVQP